MEALFVILSKPLIICAETRGDEDSYSSVYGYKIDTDDDFSSQDIEDYVGYLAAMDFWSHHPEEKCLFKIEYCPSGNPVWVDKMGGKHFNKDSFMIEVGRIYKEGLNLTYDLVKTDIDNDLYDSCIDDNLIVKDRLYNELKKRV